MNLRAAFTQSMTPSPQICTLAQSLRMYSVKCQRINNQDQLLTLGKLSAVGKVKQDNPELC